MAKKTNLRGKDVPIKINSFISSNDLLASYLLGRKQKLREEIFPTGELLLISLTTILFAPVTSYQNLVPSQNDYNTEAAA